MKTLSRLLLSVFCLFGQVSCSPLQPVMQPEIAAASWDFSIRGDTRQISVKDFADAVAAARSALRREGRFGSVKIYRVVIEGRNKLYVAYGIESAFFGHFLILEREGGLWRVTQQSVWNA